MKLTSIYKATFFYCLLFCSCKRSGQTPCKNAIQPDATFQTYEIIGDTSFLADTVFNNNYVKFKAKGKYQSVIWKLGTDPRTFNEHEFILNFSSITESLPVTFTGAKPENAECFGASNGIYSSNKKLTLVEEIQKPYLTISPLVANYRGYFIDAPSNIFTVRMEYFDSLKYNPASTGSKNFYWFSNMPDGYVDTLSNTAYSYPELRNGFKIEMGYKSFVFDITSSITGKAWLSNDTLHINYGSNISGRRKFIGKKI